YRRMQADGDPGLPAGCEQEPDQVYGGGGGNPLRAPGREKPGRGGNRRYFAGTGKSSLYLALRFLPPSRPGGNKQTGGGEPDQGRGLCLDRKSTRLNSGHVKISYAVFC